MIMPLQLAGGTCRCPHRTLGGFKPLCEKPNEGMAKMV